MKCNHEDWELIGKNFEGTKLFWCRTCGACRNFKEQAWTYPARHLLQVPTSIGPPPVAEKSLIWKRIDALSEAFEAQGEKVEDCLKFIEWISEGARVQASRRQERGGDISDD